MNGLLFAARGRVHPVESRLDEQVALGQQLHVAQLWAQIPEQLRTTLAVLCAGITRRVAERAVRPPKVTHLDRGTRTQLDLFGLLDADRLSVWAVLAATQPPTLPDGTETELAHLDRALVLAWRRP